MLTQNQLLKEIGGYGKYQICVTFFLLLSGSSGGLMMFQTVFACFVPDYQCAKFKNDVTYNVSDHCDIDDINEICEQWDYDESVVKTSIVTEYNLVCEKEKLTSLAKTIMLSGACIGILISTLADKFGRKKMLCFTHCTYLVALLGSAFSPNYWVFVIFRAIINAIAVILFYVTLVLSMEIVPDEYSTLIGMLISVTWTFWTTLITGFAYLIRTRKYLELSFLSFNIAFISFVWFIPESPKWLFTQNKTENAMKIYKKIATTNKKNVPDIDSKDLLISQTGDTHHKESFFSIFKYKTFTLQVFVIFLYWFTSSLVYYGLTLNVDSLAGDLYLNTFLNALVELPAYIVVLFALNYFGRKFPLILTMIILGVLLIATRFISKDESTINTVIGLVGKGLVSFSFTGVMIYTGEFYPTSIRASGIGMSSLFARFGGIIGPMIIEVDRNDNRVAMMIYGIIALITGLAFFMLAETKGKTIPQKLSDCFEKKTLDPVKVLTLSSDQMDL